MKIDLLTDSPVVIIGLMSGTSADGIDAAVMQIGSEGSAIEWRLLSHYAFPWPPVLRDEILSACRADAPLRQVCALNFRLGEEFAQTALRAASAAGVPLGEVAAIASHGQTIWHQASPLAIGGTDAIGTTQIGEAAVIAARTGCLVVSDFRTADMAVGGQGAPLVPFADYILFADPLETRAVQNIGGIANVTLIPRGGTLTDVLAFDTGPGNMVLDALIRRASGGRSQCDLDGALASSGRIDSALLAELLGHPYFSTPPPKSTGREDFGEVYSDALCARALARGVSDADLLATAAALTVESIAHAYERFLIDKAHIDIVILGGGGAHNPVLVSGLRARLAPARVTTHAEFGMPDSAKESAAFALLAYCTLRGRPSNVPSATGAARPALLGKISLPPP